MAKVTDERNFRSAYYEKVGCRGVEEKKSLEILMKEKPWDKNKLKQFCLRFTVPAAYRNLVWKVLLDILPVYPDSHQFVWEQRMEQFKDLLAAVETLGLADKDASPSQKLLQMWLIETEYTHPHILKDKNEVFTESFIRVADTIRSLYYDEAEVYWLAKGFAGAVRSMQPALPALKDSFLTMLEREDGELYNHLADVYALEVIPLNKWFNYCFAGILDDTSLAKIWDKICSGCFKILPLVAVMLLVTLRRNILKTTSAAEVLACVSEIPEPYEEVIANKAIELWQYYGAQPQSDQLAKK